MLKPIVGIVASAGGLQAFSKFLENMPADSGMAVVFVPHLSPDHASMMSVLLGRYSSMPVAEVEHGVHFLPNHVYVIPPNKYLDVLHGTAMLSGPVQRGILRLNPLDRFLSSLASDQQANAIAIVLSGTMTLGTTGATQVKASGGMVIAQLPTSAEQPGMPQSVIDKGIADYILTPEEMPRFLLAYVGP